MSWFFQRFLQYLREACFEEEILWRRPLQIIPLPYLIFVIFSPHTQFLVNFFSTQKRVNRDKTDLRQKCVNCDKTNFTTKKHEFYTCGGILHITHMPDVEKFQISPHLSYGKIWNYSTCGEISDFSTFITHRNLKFLHMTNFPPHVWQGIQVTNMRYGSAYLLYGEQQGGTREGLVRYPTGWSLSYIFECLCQLYAAARKGQVLAVFRCVSISHLPLSVRW